MIFENINVDNLEYLHLLMKANLNAEKLDFDQINITEALEFYLELINVKMNSLTLRKFLNQIIEYLRIIANSFSIDYYIKNYKIPPSFRKTGRLSIKHKLAFLLGRSMNFFTVSRDSINVSTWVVIYSILKYHLLPQFKNMDISKNIRDVLRLIQSRLAFRIREESQIAPLFVSIYHLFLKDLRLQNFSVSSLSNVLYGDANKIAGLFYGEGERPDLGTLFELEYRISNLSPERIRFLFKKKVTIEKVRYFILHSKILIRYYLIENNYIGKHWRTFHLIWDISYALSDHLIHSIDKKGPVSYPTYLDSNIAYKLREGQTVIRDTLDKYEVEINKLSYSKSKIMVLKTINLYKE